MKKYLALLISLLLTSNTLFAQTTTGTTEPSITLALQGVKDLKS
jgi:hypothetical protein